MKELKQWIIPAILTVVVWIVLASFDVRRAAFTLIVIIMESAIIVFSAKRIKRWDTILSLLYLAAAVTIGIWNIKWSVTALNNSLIPYSFTDFGLFANQMNSPDYLAGYITNGFDKYIEFQPIAIVLCILLFLLLVSHHLFFKDKGSIKLNILVLFCSAVLLIADLLLGGLTLFLALLASSLMLICECITTKHPQRIQQKTTQRKTTQYAYLEQYKKKMKDGGSNVQ